MQRPLISAWGYMEVGMYRAAQLFPMRSTPIDCSVMLAETACVGEG